MSASLYSDLSGGIEYVREATQEESKAVLAKHGSSFSSSKVMYSTEVGGYFATDQSEPGSADGAFVPMDEPGWTGTRAIANSSSRELQTSDWNEAAALGGCDDSYCWNCLAGGLGGVVTCGGGCVMVSWTIIGIVACVGCTLAAGGYVGYNCWKCHDLCG